MYAPTSYHSDSSTWSDTARSHAGFLYFYDAVLDRSSWEHPREQFWRRTLDDERRRVQRAKEVHDMEDAITRMVQGSDGEKMVAELRAKFLKVDINELESQMDLLRSQIEDILLAIQSEKAKDGNDETRRKIFMLQRQAERLKLELRGHESKMKELVFKLHQLLQAEHDDFDITEGKDEKQLPVTPAAVKEMCDYFGISVYSEPHLIYIAKKALEDPLPTGWQEITDPISGDTTYINTQSGNVSTDHPLDSEFFELVDTQRTRLAHMELSLFNDPWLKFFDADGVPYYFNFRTDEVSFERPMDAPMRAATRIQARMRGILERSRLEKQGFKVKRMEPPKVSAAKAKLVAQLHQSQMDAELAKARRDALLRKEAEEAMMRKMEEERKRQALEEAARVEKEKLEMLEVLRRKQARDSKKAVVIQKVYRGHIVRRNTELPWQTRERVSQVLQRAWLCHVSRKKLGDLRAMQQRALAARRQVHAAKLLQRIYRGHLGRSKYDAVRKDEGPRLRRIHAANAIKAIALASVYRSAFLAAMEDLRIMAEAHLRGETVVDDAAVITIADSNVEVYILPEDADLDAREGSIGGSSLYGSRLPSHASSNGGQEGNRNLDSTHPEADSTTSSGSGGTQQHVRPGSSSGRDAAAEDTSSSAERFDHGWTDRLSSASGRLEQLAEETAHDVSIDLRDEDQRVRGERHTEDHTVEHDHPDRRDDPSAQTQTHSEDVHTDGQGMAQESEEETRQGGERVSPRVQDIQDAPHTAHVSLEQGDAYFLPEQAIPNVSPEQETAQASSAQDQESVSEEPVPQPASETPGVHTDDVNTHASIHTQSESEREEPALQTILPETSHVDGAGVHDLNAAQNESGRDAESVPQPVAETAEAHVHVPATIVDAQQQAPSEIDTQLVQSDANVAQPQSEVVVQVVQSDADTEQTQQSETGTPLPQPSADAEQSQQSDFVAQVAQSDADTEQPHSEVVAQQIQSDDGTQEPLPNVDTHESKPDVSGVDADIAGHSEGVHATDNQPEQQQIVDESVQMSDSVQPARVVEDPVGVELAVGPDGMDKPASESEKDAAAIDESRVAEAKSGSDVRESQDVVQDHSAVADVAAQQPEMASSDVHGSQDVVPDQSAGANVAVQQPEMTSSDVAESQEDVMQDHSAGADVPQQEQVQQAEVASDSVQEQSTDVEVALPQQRQHPEPDGDGGAHEAHDTLQQHGSSTDVAHHEHEDQGGSRERDDQIVTSRVQARDDHIQTVQVNSKYEMQDPMRMTIDADYDTWTGDDEETFKRIMCGVVAGLDPEEIEILRVSRGSVIIDMLIHRVDWHDVVSQFVHDLSLPQDISKLAAAGVTKLETPSMPHATPKAHDDTTAHHPITESSAQPQDESNPASSLDVRDDSKSDALELTPGNDVDNVPQSPPNLEVEKAPHLVPGADVESTPQPTSESVIDNTPHLVPDTDADSALQPTSESVDDTTVPSASDTDAHHADHTIPQPTTPEAVVDATLRPPAAGTDDVDVKDQSTPTVHDENTTSALSDRLKRPGEDLDMHAHESKETMEEQETSSSVAEHAVEGDDLGHDIDQHRPQTVNQETAMRPVSADADRMFRQGFSGGIEFEPPSVRPVSADEDHKFRQGFSEGTEFDTPAVRPVSADADRWFRQESFRGVEFESPRAHRARPQSSSAVSLPSTSAQAQAHALERPRTGGPEMMHERGASVSAKYKRPTSAMRGRQAPGDSKQGVRMGVRFKRDAEAPEEKLRVTEPALPREAEDYLSLEGDADVEGGQEFETGRLQGLDEKDEWEQTQEHVHVDRDELADSRGREMSTAELTLDGNTLGTDYTLDEGSLLTTQALDATAYAGGGLGASQTADMLDASYNNTYTASSGHVTFAEQTDSARAREMEASLSRLFVSGVAPASQTLHTPAASRIQPYDATPGSAAHDRSLEDDDMDLSLQQTKVVVAPHEPTRKDAHTKPQHTQDDAVETETVDPEMSQTVKAPAQAESEYEAMDVRTPMKARLAAAKPRPVYTLEEQIAQLMPKDFWNATLKSIPLQYVGRTLVSLTENELFGVGRSMGVNTRRLLLQVGGHEKAVKMIAAMDVERSVRIVRAQSFYRGHLSRRRTGDRLKNYLRDKEMKAMEESIRQARNKGAATMLQRVARGHAGRLLWRKTLHDKLEKIRIEMETRHRYLEVHCSKQAWLVTRVCRGHIGRNLYRLEKELAERERQLAQFDEMKVMCVCVCVCVCVYVCEGKAAG
jgi:hypothetical protein